MRAIQSNLAVIGRNVSNLSPHASYMMDSLFFNRQTHRAEPESGLENVHFVPLRGGLCRACLAAFTHAYLWIRCVMLSAVFVFLLQQSGHADLEGRCRNY